MDFKAPTVDIQRAIKLARSVAPVVTAAGGERVLLINAFDQRVEFVAYGLDSQLKVVINAEVATPGRVVVPTRELNSALSAFAPVNSDGNGTEVINVRVPLQGHFVELLAKTVYLRDKILTHTKKVPTITECVFPRFPKKGTASTLEVMSSELSSGVKEVLHAASTDKNQAVFAGVFFNVSNGSLTLAATNGFVIAECIKQVTYSGEDLSVIIPGSVATLLAKVMVVDEPASVVVTDNSLFVMTDSLVIGGPLVNGEFPDYRSVLPEITKTVTVGKSIFCNTIRSLSYETSKDRSHSRATFLFEGTEMAVKSAEGTVRGVQVEGNESFVFDCNAKLISASARAVDSDKITVGFCGPRKLIRIFPAEGGIDCGSQVAIVPLGDK